MRGREDVDAQGKVQWLYMWKPEVACLLIVRMAPGDYTFMDSWLHSTCQSNPNGSSDGYKESEDSDGE